MRRGRRVRWFLVLLSLYLSLCTVGGIYLADGSLHPARRPLDPGEVAAFTSALQPMQAKVQEVAITTPDRVTLRAWLLRPIAPNGKAVLVLHGLADNRLGMTGYAELLLTHGYTVLLPDARAHGVSEGKVATFGVLEQEDIHEWFDFVSATHPHCIYGMGESMGASQLLQSLETESRFCAVVAESPFSTFREIAYDRMGQPFRLGPWVGRTVLRPLVEIAFLRARWKYGLRMGQISPAEAASKSRVPILLIHGQTDGNIPVRHSEAIHAQAARTVLWEVPGADHCGALAVAPEEFTSRVLGWFGGASVAAREMH